MNNHEIRCVHCGNTGHDPDALNCLFCGESLPVTTGFMARLSRPKSAAAFALLIIAAFLLFLFL